MTASAPDDWSDISGWDRHHAETLAALPFHIRLQSDRSLVTVRPLLADPQLQRVWYPGAGLSLAPTLASSGGKVVTASDHSAVALDHQRAIGDELARDELLATLRYLGVEAANDGSLDVVRLDHRSQRPDIGVDAVVDVRAFIGLEPGGMAQAARQYALALGTRGLLYMILGGVEAERRVAAEAHLAAAGFYVPMQAQNVWLAEAIAADGKSNAVFQEYHRRCDASQSEVAAVMGARDRLIARVEG